MNYDGDNLLTLDQQEFQGDMPDRLQIVLRQLTPWTKPIQLAQEAFNISTNIEIDYNIFAQPLHNGSEAQMSLAQNFQILYRASNNMHQGRTINTHTNLQLLGFMMNWHITVRLVILYTYANCH